MDYKNQRYIVLAIAFLVIGFGVWHCLFNPKGPMLLAKGKDTDPDVDAAIKEFTDDASE